MKRLYNKLRKLVSDRFQIAITDRTSLGYATVAITPCNGKFPWTRFEGKTIEQALERTIKKLENPNEDYESLDGYIWKANESSIYESQHIRGFLRGTRNE